MSARNSAAKPGAFPWAGLLALILAIGVSAFLLLTEVRPAALLNTWYLTRASGLVAFVLLWASVALGLLQATGLLKGVSAPAASLEIHQYVSVGALYATTFHAVILLWDHYIPFRLWDLLIPFGSSYKPLLVGPGSLGFYIALLAAVTTYFRNKMNSKTWRALHQFSLLGFFAAMIHGLALGTDSNLWAVGFMYRFAFISVAVLLVARVLKGVAANANPAGRG